MLPVRRCRAWQLPVADRRLPIANRQPAIANSTAAGAVLLEVVVALVLFATAAAVIGGALSASIASLDRLRAQTHAEDLAITVLSQIQMGLLPAFPAGPEPFEPPFTEWTWELELAPAGERGLGHTEPLQRVEVIVRQLDGPVVRRLVQWLAVPEESEEDLGLP